MPISTCYETKIPANFQIFKVSQKKLFFYQMLVLQSVSSIALQIMIFILRKLFSFFFPSQNVRDEFLCLSMFSVFHGSTDPPSVADENEYLPPTQSYRFLRQTYSESEK